MNNVPVIDPSLIPQMHLLGLRVHMVQIPEVVSLMMRWITQDRSRCHWIAVPDMHGAIEAHKDPQFRAMIALADLTVPDGISLVWVARLKGFPLKKRVSGTDIIRAFFMATERSGSRNYFYGDTDETLGRLAMNVKKEFPGLTIAGCYSPPFHPLTAEEDQKIIQRINDAKPDILWVGLGLPKQEQWIFDHRDKLQVPLVIGVGAAFKFLAGTVQRAPAWVGNLGFEWLWRLVHEPRKMWHRYLIGGPQFIGCVVLELTGLRKH